MKKLILIAMLVLTSAMAAQTLYAETPCTQAGQESLQQLFQCVGSAPAKSLLPAQDAVLMNALQNDPIAQPQPHAINPGYGPTPVEGLMLGTTYRGRSYYMNPYYWGY